MTIDQLINLLVTITLVEMMAATGLGVTFGQLAGVAKNWRLVMKAALANYGAVPVVTVGLLLLFGAQPMVAAGFLILAACPGAPFGPPCTAIAKGNVAVSVGLMVILAGSSALIAPVLLHFLLPLMAGNEAPKVDALKVVSTLLAVQLVPLAIGLCVRQWRPKLAERLKKPADLVSLVLNLVMTGIILVAQFRLLAEIRLRGFVGMLALAGTAVGQPRGRLAAGRAQQRQPQGHDADDLPPQCRRRAGHRDGQLPRHASRARGDGLWVDRDWRVTGVRPVVGPACIGDTSSGRDEVLSVIGLPGALTPM
jgi:BASS family bile acid:Na+ symporter